MMTPHERLARMRKSFERDRSVLGEDYEYRNADAPVMPRVFIRRNKVAHKSAEQSAPKSPKRIEGIHRIKAAVETKYEFIEVGLQMTRLDTTVVSAIDPRLQVREDKMDHRQMFLCFLGPPPSESTLCR